TVVVAIFLIWVLIQIWGILLQVVLAFLLATALGPLVKRLQNRGLSHGAASLWVFASLILIIVGFFWLILPPLISQAQSLIDNAPEYLKRFEDFIRRYPSLDEIYQRMRNEGEGGGQQGMADVPVEQALQVSADI